MQLLFVCFNAMLDQCGKAKIEEVREKGEIARGIETREFERLNRVIGVLFGDKTHVDKNFKCAIDVTEHTRSLFSYSGDITVMPGFALKPPLPSQKECKPSNILF